MNKHEMFLDWFNNYATIGFFADCNRLTIKKAEKVIRIGYLMHESQFSGMVFEVMGDYEMDKGN